MLPAAVPMPSAGRRFVSAASGHVRPQPRQIARLEPRSTAYAGSHPVQVLRQRLRGLHLGIPPGLRSWNSGEGKVTLERSAVEPPGKMPTPRPFGSRATARTNDGDPSSGRWRGRAERRPYHRETLKQPVPPRTFTLDSAIRYFRPSRFERIIEAARAGKSVLELTAL